MQVVSEVARSPPFIYRRKLQGVNFEILVLAPRGYLPCLLVLSHVLMDTGSGGERFLYYLVVSRQLPVPALTLDFPFLTALPQALGSIPEMCPPPRPPPPPAPGSFTHAVLLHEVQAFLSSYLLPGRLYPSLSPPSAPASPPCGNLGNQP